MTDIYSILKPIQSMDTVKQRWRSLKKPHLLLVDTAQVTIRPKDLILHQTLGVKLKLRITVYTVNSKFSLVTIFCENVFLYFHHIFELLFQTLNFSIYAYATVTTSEGALFIGGYADGSIVATVTSYNTDYWRKLNDLQSIRRFHRAIINGDKVYVVGGQDGYP